MIVDDWWHMLLGAATTEEPVEKVRLVTLSPGVFDCDFSLMLASVDIIQSVKLGSPWFVLMNV